MAKHRKIRRFEYEWGGQRRQWWKRFLLSVTVVVVFGIVGWIAYEPVYNLVMGLDTQRSAASSQSETEASSSSQSSSAPAVQPEPEQPQGLPEKTYYLPPQVVASPTQLEQQLSAIKAAGGTGVAFELKNAKGQVLYKSELPQVAQALTQAESPYDLPGLLRTITDAGLAPVGVLHAFQDSTATSAASLSDGAVKYMDGPVNWLDNAKADGGKPWLNPNSPIARDYILALVEETTRMGVSNLVLESVQFPTGFSLHLASYGGSPDRPAVLADFVTQAQAVAQRSDAQVYPVVRLDALVGANDIPYGSQPGKLLQAAGQGIVDVSPAQFGAGVATPQLTLTSPLLAPYDTVQAALAVAMERLGADTQLELAAKVQAYTAAGVDAASNKAYGKAEADQQQQAAQEQGLTKSYYYSPAGVYQ